MEGWVGHRGILLPLAEILRRIPEAGERLSQEVRLMLVLAVIKSEFKKIADEKDAKNTLRTTNWWGSWFSPLYY